MKKSCANPWIIFLINIGLILIVFSPKTEKPIVMIIVGLFIVCVSSLILRKQKVSREKEENENDKIF